MPAAALNHAIDANDRETWRRAAHKLRGEAATLGFNALPVCSSGWRARRPRQTKACRATCATR
jgi:HPt (histidine-containing phosphotransfer) domain-containing protein